MVVNIFYINVLGKTSHSIILSYKDYYYPLFLYQVSEEDGKVTSIETGNYGNITLWKYSRAFEIDNEQYIDEIIFAGDFNIDKFIEYCVRLGYTVLHFKFFFSDD